MLYQKIDMQDTSFRRQNVPDSSGRMYVEGRHNVMGDKDLTFEPSSHKIVDQTL